MKRETLTGFQPLTPKHVLAALLWCTVLAPVGLFIAFAWIVFWLDAATKGETEQSMIENSSCPMEQSENDRLNVLSIPASTAVLEFA